MPRIDQDAGKGMAQVMNAHIGKIQLSAQVVPEQVDVGERSARCAPGKEPGAVGAAWQMTDDCYGLVGKDNMAWAVRLGKGHRQQMFLQVDMLPAGLEDFALACAGQQQKLQGLGLQARGAVQGLQKPPCLMLRQVSLPQLPGRERSDAHAR